MAGLWAIIGALILCGVAAVVAPLARRRQGFARRGDFDLRVYKDQLEEVERDLERGLLTAEQADAARTEIKRRMLAAAPGEANGAETESTGSNGVMIAGLAIAVPVAALTLYLSLGRPGLPDRPLAARQAEIEAQAQNLNQAQDQARRNTEMSVLADRLAAKMEAKPDDVEGWRLLARTYANLERFEDAARAYGRALQLSGRDPDILASYGEVLIFVEGGAVPAAALGVFKEVIAKGGDDPRARFYLGLASAQQGNPQAAMDHWLALAKASPADAPWLPGLRQRIQAAAEDLGVETPAMATLPPSQPSGQPAAPLPESPVDSSGAAPGPSQADMEAAGRMSAQDRDAMVRSMVQRLAERLEENPSDREGWVRLERAYRVLGETEKADRAKARLEALQ